MERSKLIDLPLAGLTARTAREPLSRTASMRKHHLDPYADAIAAEPGSDDELLTTPEMAVWLRVSVPWLEIGRVEGYGPPFERLGPRCIRYSRGKVKKWLNSRSHLRTSEYA
jgi:hypothetical protein